MYKLLLILILTVTCINAHAQDGYVFGYVKDSITELPIQDVYVSETKGDTSDYTNASGLFVMKASLGDTLTLIRVGYYAKKVVLAGTKMMDTLRITLVPKTDELESVIVSAYSYADYQADSADRRNFFDTAIGHAKPLFDNANTGAGLGISLDRIFSQKQRNKKRSWRLFQSVEKEKYVDFRFNPIVVHSYTGLKGDSLQVFMNKYRPSYEWLRSHTTQTDLLYYINARLKSYHKR